MICWSLYGPSDSLSEVCVVLQGLLGALCGSLWEEKPAGLGRSHVGVELHAPA